MLSHRPPIKKLVGIQYFIAGAILLSLIWVVVMMERFSQSNDSKSLDSNVGTQPKLEMKEKTVESKEQKSDVIWTNEAIERKGKKEEKSISALSGQKTSLTKKPSLTSTLQNNIHAFYYPWYGNLETDGIYLHWNHEILVGDKDRKRCIPPDEIGSNFYPKNGLYSSHDKHAIDLHMKEIAESKVGVICTSWYPPSSGDEQAAIRPGFSDKIVSTLLDSANNYGIKVNFHIEPYKERNADTLKRDIEYINKNYGAHPALHRIKGKPVVYVYDSYLTPPSEWAGVLSAKGKNTIRGTPLDCIVLGLLVESRHQQDILTSGFDGFYTYFATDGFTFGSSTRNWKDFVKWGNENNLISSLSVGPGYDDTRIRPWNAVNRRSRKNGRYYQEMWNEATLAMPDIVSITSYNEWGEGTQIESAVPRPPKGDIRYQDYTPNPPSYYLSLTNQLVTSFAEHRLKITSVQVTDPS